MQTAASGGAVDDQSGSGAAEHREKARACKIPEDIPAPANRVLSLAKDMGHELSDEEIERIAGGGSWICGDHTCDTYRHFVHC